jgi:glycosyltransferase involved in cell wall biosynthesis
LLQDSGGSLPQAGLPLVSILIPTGDQDTPELLLRTVHSALAQHYGHCEIIVSDSGKGDLRRRQLARLLAAHPQLRYNRAPMLDADDNLDHCLTLALGDYIAVALAGDLLDAEKFRQMMRFYLAYPSIGLVACWRQALDRDGAPLPGTPLLAVEAAVGGASLAAMLLTSEHGAGDVLCQPAAAAQAAGCRLRSLSRKTLPLPERRGDRTGGAGRAGMRVSAGRPVQWPGAAAGWRRYAGRGSGPGAGAPAAVV